MADTQSKIEAVEMSFSIIDLLAKTGNLGVTEIADELDIPKSTAYNHLSTLEELGYAVNQDGTYRLGANILEPGIRMRNRNQLYVTARPHIEELTNQTGEISGLLVEEGGYGVILYRSKGDRAVHLDTHVGKQIPLHASAMGKAILAYLPEDRVDQIINTHGLTKLTPHTITDREELFEELQKIRDEGIARDDEELMLKVRGVAAPIQLNNGTPVGSISVATPIHRMQQSRFREELPDLIESVVNTIELNLMHNPTQEMNNPI